MNGKIDSPKDKTSTNPPSVLKSIPERPSRALIFAGALGTILLTGYWTLAQSAPGFSIAKTGTNQISITITNGISTDSYELWWTPSLGDPVDFPWTMAAVGNIGQTNFLLANSGYPAVFFRGLLDTNVPPLWENANPNNPGTNILKITIAGPANGALLQ